MSCDHDARYIESTDEGTSHCVYCWWLAAEAEIKELRVIVDKLPKTGDGVPVVPGIKVWGISPWNDVRELPVTMNCFDDIADCYSTRKAAEKAEGED